MTKLINITRWPSIGVFILAGVVGVVFAFVTVNLFTQAMANVEFLQRAGFEALRHGALWQVLELVIYGAIALLCWVIFKICEQVLEDRYLAWAQEDEGQAPNEKTNAWPK
ncbi:MAG: hypothetical protein AAGD04_14465 [Pseudomonadota bacterium]